MAKIDLFRNHSYSTGPCAKKEKKKGNKKNKIKTKQNKTENTKNNNKQSKKNIKKKLQKNVNMNNVHIFRTSRHKISQDELRCH